MTPDSEMVPVVQSDRDAAKALWQSTAGWGEQSEKQNAFVQAFARYRTTIASEADAAAIERAAGIAENWNGLTCDGNTFFIADAIRASQLAANDAMHGMVR